MPAPRTTHLEIHPLAIAIGIFARVALGVINSSIFFVAIGAASETVDFQSQVAPVLTKYCAGCHNADDAESDLALDSFEGLARGGESGRIVTPGAASSSRLIAVLRGDAKPAMPPDGEPRPTDDEIALLEKWIENGAIGPDGSASQPAVLFPKLQAPEVALPVTAVDIAPDGKTLAVGRFGRVEISSLDVPNAPPRVLIHPGKVESVRFSSDGVRLISASGVTGAEGRAQIWDLESGEITRAIPSPEQPSDVRHRDMLYAAAISPNGELIATAGYDQSIILWNAATGEPIRELTGHNGAIFDLSFSPDGKQLVTASADATVKVWRVETGERLDTRSEPIGEQYTTAFSPDGALFAAGGEDNRIRVWGLVSTEKRAINPIVHSRFAHDGAVNLIRFSDDGRLLVSAGRDQQVKLWETDAFQQIHAWPAQSAPVYAVAISSVAGRVAVGRMDGTVELFPIPDVVQATATSSVAVAKSPPAPPPTGVESQLTEREPNDSLADAQPVTAPARVRGVIDATEEAGADEDIFRFSSRANQTWIVEVIAARDKWPLDSHIAILDADGRPIPRVVLQATRDSYFTFRGKDSEQDNDFRLHNWEEMRLNQYLYCNGEVVRFFAYPRGPDSGYDVFASHGKRRTYFDTSALTHALNEPCFVVEPASPDASVIPTGLPSFMVNYENDDDGLRRFGDDSFLSFVAPRDGDYNVRVRDVRGLGGDAFRYELAIRPPREDFSIRAVHRETNEIRAGAGIAFNVEIDRIDGFGGPVTIHIEGLPDGFTTNSPLTIEADQVTAQGLIFADDGAGAVSEEDAAKIKFVAAARIDGREVKKWPFDFGKLEFKPEAKLRAFVRPDATDPQEKDGLPIIEIDAGSSTTFIVGAERAGYEGRVSFGKHDALLNAPHGVYVADIGLNGLQIQENETERTAVLVAEPWVTPQERVVFVLADEEGKPASRPVLLRVK